MTIHKRLLDSINNRNRHTLIVGCGGCGKSYLINAIVSERNDVIHVAPSGIAALNIGGQTIQSFFSITPRQYTGEVSMKNKMNIETINKIKSASILLIDEISMLRCEILDIVDFKLKILRNNTFPFGGIKLILLGDPCQLEPVTLADEKEALNSIYPDVEDYNFYNSHILRKNEYFYKNFDMFFIDEDYRHSGDIPFKNLLSHIRLGKTSLKGLNILNNRFFSQDIRDTNYLYLTVTNEQADVYNNYFLNELKGGTVLCEANIEGDGRKNKTPFRKILNLKIGMKVMFVKNDLRMNGSRWVNGTMGYITRINFSSDDEVFSVLVKVNDREYEVFREKYGLDIGKNYGTIEQFPLIPAWAITIDKSQGLTLDKVAIVMGNNRNRDNQMYVALSRPRKLKDIIILGRPIRSADIRLSYNTKRFLDTIEDKIEVIKNNINTKINVSLRNCKNIVINNILSDVYSI
jgi:hypothetical protein